MYIFRCEDTYTIVRWWIGTMVLPTGLQTSRIPGLSYRYKRANILRMTIDDIQGLVKDGGFFVRFTDAVADNGSTVLIVPSGFMILVAASKGRLLRWPLLADEADAARVRECLRHLLDDFPELRNPETSYVQFAQTLGMNV